MQTLAGAGEDLYQHWEVPGKPMAIDLSLGVVGAIFREGAGGLIRRRKPETGGILLGVVEVGETVTIKIEECVELPCEHLFGPSYSLSESEKEALRHALAQYAPGSGPGLYAVGFYRTHTRRGLRLDSDDLLLADFFPDRADLVLLVKPRRLLRSRAAFFFWEDGQVRPDAAAIAFSIPRRVKPGSGSTGEREGPPEPADAVPEPAGAVAEPADAVPEPAGAVAELAETAPESVPEPAAATPRPRRKPWWCSLWIQAPLFACLLVAWGLLGFFAGRQVDKVIPRTQPPPVDPYALSLMIVEYGDNLHLEWDHQARPITLAERGSLVITDAGQSRTLDLSVEQLRTGSVAYHKIGNFVVFKLEVFLPAHRSVSETREFSGANH
jgi:hypothetical protein